MRLEPGGGSRFGVPPYEAAAAGVNPQRTAPGLEPNPQRTKPGTQEKGHPKAAFL